MDEITYLKQFNYQILGQPSAPKLVFLHGLMGSGANWRKVTSILEKDYHILVFDQRGHGRSFHPEQGYDPEDFALDLLKILDELGWAKVALVGHSMGGRNALNFSYRWPQRVMGLVLEDIGPDVNEEVGTRIQHWIEMIPTPFPSRRAAKDYLLGQFPETLAQFFYSNIEETEKGQANWRFSKPGVLASLQAGRQRDRWEELKALKMPTLVIRGKDSANFKREIFARMLKENPRLQGVEIPNAGHWVHADQPEGFVRELKKFLDTLPRE
jgi:esterase